jgi:hypothetical protein
MSAAPRGRSRELQSFRSCWSCHDTPLSLNDAPGAIHDGLMAYWPRKCCDGGHTAPRRTDIGRLKLRAARRAERPCSAASSPRRTPIGGAMSAWTMLPSSTGGQYNPTRRHRRGRRMDVCLLLTCINLRGTLVPTTAKVGAERGRRAKSPRLGALGTSRLGSRHRSAHPLKL